MILRELTLNNFCLYRGEHGRCHHCARLVQAAPWIPRGFFACASAVSLALSYLHQAFRLMPLAQRVQRSFTVRSDVMAQDTKARPQKPPEKKIGPFASGIGVAIWLNETESDDGQIRTFRSITLNPRRYFDSKSGQWKDAASYQQSDLPSLIFSLQKSHA